MSNLLKAFASIFATPPERAQGPDISHYDEYFKPEIAAQRIDFVFMKLTEGVFMTDSTIAEMWKGMQQIPVRGGYHYQRSGFSWEQQAKYFLNVAMQLDLQVYILDVEEIGNFYDDTFFADTRRIIDYWRKHAPDKRILLYTNGSTYKQLYAAMKRLYSDGVQWLEGVDFWYAWPSKLVNDPVLPSMRKAPWRFWQKAWDGTQADWGTGSAADVNVFNGSRDELLAWAGMEGDDGTGDRGEGDKEEGETDVVVLPRVEPTTEPDLWNAEVVSLTRVNARFYPQADLSTYSGIYVSKGETFSGRLWVGNGYLWVKITEASRPELVGKWVACRAEDGSGVLIVLRKPVGETPKPASGDIYRLLKWGDPILVKEASRSVVNMKNPDGAVSNFQAIGMFNKASNTMGGVSNWLRIPHGDVMRLAALQVEDSYIAKVEDWRDQKMRWLCTTKGTIYFRDTLKDRKDWKKIDWIKWGTIGLGNNLVQVEGVETLTVKTPDNVKRSRKMARLVGFMPTDWARPLNELVASGLVHRCYCVYGKDNSIGDSPKGIVWSPFWSPRGWQFGGGKGQPDAFYLPLDWMIKV